MKNKKISQKELTAKNKALQETSRLLFGNDAELRIVEPQKLRILRENARYFKKDQFRQLVKNIKDDERLSGTPLCYQLEDGTLEVLSGNHRVKASVEAKLSYIVVMVITANLSRSEQIAIQLSHNALVGEDDQDILANLWAKIDDIKSKTYAGLSSETMKEIKEISLVNFSTPQPKTKYIAFAFTELEYTAINEILNELESIPVTEIHLAAMDQFDDFFQAIRTVKQSANIKNSSLAVLHLIQNVHAAIEMEQEECRS